MPDYLSSWDVKSLAGEPIAVVRVRNLHHVIQGPHDAWGRPGKSQPVLISAELSFRRPFGSVAADDKLGSGTVHYGSLSKAILRVLDRFGSPPASSDGDGGASTLRDVLDALWLSLTGFAYPGSEDRTETQATSQPFLDLSVLRYLSVTVTLPKASLLGQSVSLSASSTFGLQGGFHALQGYSTTLQLHDLRVPVLIGVNPNERLAKQVVGVDVEIDKCYPYEDTYTNLERIVVKAMEDSSFETLEALGSRLARDTLDNYGPILEKDQALLPSNWRIQIRMEKPTAVPAADCPVVELSFPADTFR